MAPLTLETEERNRSEKLQAQWSEAICRNMDLPEGYAQVAVLIIKWDERIDELKCAEEVNELEALFRDDFHYETNIISLDEKSSPHHQLIHAMSGFLRKFDGPNNLLIIYYTGHAGYNKENGELEFSARTNSAAASNASWNVAETLFLKGTQADTLAILDTCYASNITKGAEYTGRAYQLLAASAYDRMTAGPGHKSFTNAMIESLRECLVENSQAPFSLWKLSTKINEKQYRRKNPCIPHDRLKKHDRQIFLAPLKENKGKREENRKVLSERTGVADLTLRFALGTTSLTRERIERLSKELPKACNAADVKLCSIDWVGFERRPVNFAAAVRAFSYARRWLRMTRGKKEDLPQKGSVANPTGIDNVRDPAHQEATSIRVGVTKMKSDGTNSATDVVLTRRLVSPDSERPAPDSNEDNSPSGVRRKESTQPSVTPTSIGLQLTKTRIDAARDKQSIAGQARTSASASQRRANQSSILARVLAIRAQQVQEGSKSPRINQKQTEESTLIPPTVKVETTYEEANVKVQRLPIVGPRPIMTKPSWTNQSRKRPRLFTSREGSLLNFRLRGIPHHYQSESDVQALVINALSLEPEADLEVCSLATNPVERSSRVATIVFQDVPPPLSGNPRNQWVVPLPNIDDDDGDARGSPRKPLVFDTHFAGFTPLQHADEEDCHIDLIALSGLGGHAFGSFKDRDGTFMWLRDALPLDIHDFRILIYGYDTRTAHSNSFQNLLDLGRALQTDIRTVRNLSRHRPLLFLGHSLGGLVIKEAITRMREDEHEEDEELLKSVVGFVFFGVPHHGMTTESLVPLFQDQPNRALLESLGKNSDLLSRLQKDFDKAISAQHPEVVSYYETESSPTACKNGDKWEMSGSLQVLVDRESAVCGSKSKDQYPLNRNHSEMVKYSNPFDERYTRVKATLERLAGLARPAPEVAKFPLLGLSVFISSLMRRFWE